MTVPRVSTYHALVTTKRDPDGHYVADIYRGQEWVKVLVGSDRDELVRRAGRWVAWMQSAEVDREQIDL